VPELETAASFWPTQEAIRRGERVQRGRLSSGDEDSAIVDVSLALETHRTRGTAKRARIYDFVSVQFSNVDVNDLAYRHVGTILFPSPTGWEHELVTVGEGL